MWDILFYFRGSVKLKIRCSRIVWFTEMLAKQGIILRNIRIDHDTELCVTILEKDFAAVKAYAQKSLCEIVEEKHSGFSKTFYYVLKRPAIVVGLLISVLCGILIPKFVWFYKVEGNATVPSQLILRELRELGVGFGTFGPSIHPQEIKNRILLRIPELSWITVQQHGARAVVVVRERPQKLAILDRKTPCDMIAARSAVITKMEVLQGHPLCRVGDCVIKGQTLVSAFEDFEFTTSVSTSVAEIYGHTVHRYLLVCPPEYQKKKNQKTSEAVDLVIGQKRLHLFGAQKQSGLSCDKQVKTIPFRLWDDLILPIRIEIITKTDYDTDSLKFDLNSARFLLSDTARAYTESRMMAGTVLSQNEPADADLQRYCYHAVFSCEEMIGRIQKAELLKDVTTND